MSSVRILRLTYEVGGDLELTSQYVGAYCEIPGDTVVDRILEGTGKIWTGDELDRRDAILA